MRHFFFPYANRGASLVHAHVCRKGGKITGLGVCKKLEVSPVQWFNSSEVELFQNPCSKLETSSRIWCRSLDYIIHGCN